MAAETFTFATVTTKLTKFGSVRKPAILKMLRSGKVAVTVVSLQTDDTGRLGGPAPKSSRGQARDPLETAAEIVDDGTGWRCSPNDDGSLSLSYAMCIYLRVTEVEPSEATQAMAEVHAAKEARVRARVAASAERAQAIEAERDIVIALAMLEKSVSQVH